MRTKIKHKLLLEVEIECPLDSDHPELHITKEEVAESLLGSGTYAVCGDNPKKYTAFMSIKKVTEIDKES